jgi:transposase
VNKQRKTMKRPKDRLVAGIDLHSNNVMIGVMNQDGKRVGYRKVDCNLEEVIEFLEPLKPQLQSLAVESTFNWYWLVDGLRAKGYPIDLANPAKIEQYNGLKHAADKDDAFSTRATLFSKAWNGRMKPSQGR